MGLIISMFKRLFNFLFKTSFNSDVSDLYDLVVAYEIDVKREYHERRAVSFVEYDDKATIRVRKYGAYSFTLELTLANPLYERYLEIVAEEAYINTRSDIGLSRKINYLHHWASKPDSKWLYPNIKILGV